MANRNSIGKDDKIFKVREDGTIVREDEVTSQAQSALDRELLEIIEVNSYSKKILAAYRARKLANKICKQEYGKANYKEYVEMLMVKHFPKEYEKSEAAAKFLRWRKLWFPIIIVADFFLCMYITEFFHDLFHSYDTALWFACIIGIAILILIVVKLFIPVYKTLKKTVLK